MQLLFILSLLKEVINSREVFLIQQIKFFLISTKSKLAAYEKSATQEAIMPDFICFTSWRIRYNRHTLKSVYNDDDDDADNNKHICIAPLGRDFRGVL